MSSLRFECERFLNSWSLAEGAVQGVVKPHGGRIQQEELGHLRQQDMPKPCKQLLQTHLPKSLDMTSLSSESPSQSKTYVSHVASS